MFIKKIYDFENINTISFVYTFFVENEIKKYYEYFRNNELIDKIDIKDNKRKETQEIYLIINVYNQEKCLFKALKRVLNPSIKNIEIIDD